MDTHTGACQRQRSSIFLSIIAVSMNSLAFFSLLAGALQLSIPPYALRLIRRFGVQQVGWFLVSAFACLGLLHLLEPLRILRPTFGSIITLDAIYAIGSVLLLIGMDHVVTI